jgi:hypothetical protein
MVWATKRAGSIIIMSAPIFHPTIITLPDFAGS